MTRTAPPTSSSAQPSSSSTLTMNSQTVSGPSIDVQNQLTQRFSLESGMNIEYSKLLVLVLIFK
jgi:hypothetical protein